MRDARGGGTRVILRVVRPTAVMRLATVMRLLGVVLVDADLRRTEIASSVSTTARWAYFVALLVIAYEAAGAAGLATVAIIRTVPAVIAVPLAGAAGSRMDGRALLILAYAARSVVAVLGGVAIALGLPVALLLMAAVDAVLGTLRRPIQGALLPFIARAPSDLVAANVGTTFGEALASIVGPIIGAAALAAAGPVAGFALAAAGFAVSAVLMALVDADDALTLPRRSVIATLRDGSDALAASPVPRLIATGSLAVMFAAGIVSVLLLPAAVGEFGMSDAGVGQLLAAIGVGGLVGAVLAFAAARPAAAASAFVVSIVGAGVALVALGLTALVPAAFVALGAFGLSRATLEVAGYSLLQRTLPVTSRTAALSAFEGAAEGTLGIGGVVGSLLLTAVGVSPAFVVCGAGLVIGGMALAPALLAHRARLDARNAIVEQLHSSRLLAPLPLATVEMLASAAQACSFGDGDVVVHEGDVEQPFHVITRGRVDVIVDGASVRRYGPGDGVGDPALLRDAPRSSTARANGSVDTLAIAPADFIAAVTRRPGSHRGAAGLGHHLPHHWRARAGARHGRTPSAPPAA